MTFRRAPRLEIEFEDDSGPHVIRVIAADGKNVLGTSPTLVIGDERGHWPLDKGDDLEHALLSGLGKRGGRMLLISTSASNDAHPFSKWLDDDQPGIYRQEHRADDGCAPDDIEQIRKANPGAEYGVGSSLEWLQQQARRAVERGGSALTSWRLYNLNQRVTGTVGGGTVPEIVDEAFRRLAEYMAAAKKGAPGATRERVSAGSITVDKSRSASWAAAAMANSGAGDLLRNYRRV